MIKIKYLFKEKTKKNKQKKINLSNFISLQVKQVGRKQI